jgi:hypothetical protein
MNPVAVYDEVKADHAGADVLVRVGDFHEAHDDGGTTPRGSAPIGARWRALRASALTPVLRS